MKIFLSFVLMLCIIFFNTYTFATEKNIVQFKLQQLEKTFQGKIGVYAFDTNNKQIIAYRANERFPIQSTSKLMGVGLLLKQSENQPNLLNEMIHYSKKELTYWSPVTAANSKFSMTLNSLAAATISYSDDTAFNLIIKKLGGLKKINQFARSLNNQSFQIEHFEPHLNSNPKLETDSATPKDMAQSLEKLTLKTSILSANSRHELITWLRNNTTGYTRIRSGVPDGWVVADKTGSGSYGIANDIGIVWSPSCKPIVMAIYTVKNNKNTKWQNTIVAKITKIIMQNYQKTDKCFAETNLS